MNLLAEYIKYRLKAKKRHGIHSPFIYEMSDIVFRQKIDSTSQKTIDDYRNTLLNDNQLIEVKDFGAGSKKMGDQRMVSSIFKTSSAGNFGKRLFQLSHFYKPTRILELGTSLGFGSLHFALGNPDSQVVSIEGCPNTAEIAKSMLSNYPQIEIRVGQFSEQIPLLEGTFDIIYIDGHHDGLATLKYLEQLTKHIHDETLILLDDIRWSIDMYDTWKTVVNSSDWHVTVDLFRMGIAVQRKTQVKEHFTLRF